MEPVEEFAAWLRELHLDAHKPSYATIVGRIRELDPSATVVASTISECLAGRRLPRWETVAPIAQALGGKPALAECERRWKRAHAAQHAAGSETSTAAVPVEPQAEPAPGGEGEVPSPPGGPRVPRWVLWACGSLLLASVLALAALSVTDMLRGPPRPDADRSAPAAGRGGRGAAPGSESSRAASAAAPPAPQSGTYEVVIRHRGYGSVADRVGRTPDGLVRIQADGYDLSDSSVTFLVTTSLTSCTDTTLVRGQALVVPEATTSGVWVRIVFLSVEWLNSSAFETNPDTPADVRIRFQVTEGIGPSPAGTRTCT